jgi:hypothetical protein
MFFNLNRYWIFLFLIVLSYGLLEYYRPKPIDWRESYSNKDKIPFGAEVIYDLLPELLGGQKVESLRIPPYNHLDKIKSSKKTSYVFIGSSFAIDKNDQNSLVKYVERGNVVFISAYDFSSDFLDTLGIKAPRHKPSMKDTAKYVQFVNPLLREKKGFIFPRDDGSNYLELTKSANATVLAVNEDKEPVFIRLDLGKGQFYIHNLALAFTNYYVLDPKTSKHAFQALSYLPKQPVYWDEYQKQGRFGENEHSVFRYIVSTPGLKTAYILALIGLILYAVFSGKRRQRVIPIVNAPKNVSLEFVKTIGNMYYRKGDHANMAGKLAQHFWIYIRERFGINPGRYSENDLVEVIAKKSGLTQSVAQSLVEELNDDSGKWTGKRLMELNQSLEDFYERTK